MIAQHQTASTGGRTGTRTEAVVVGASAGAFDALSVVLPALPPDYPLPVLVVVHLPPDKKSILAELFRARCRVDVREAEDKEPIRAGVAYFAPPDYHILVERDRRLSLSSDEPVNYSRPSIDVLFESAADVYGAGLLGVVLTGASSDGAAGLRAVREAGGTALVQRPDRAAASAMPRAALAACPESRALTLEEIAAYLLEVATRS
jgi:two-component system chemotaxis response regulator CheB